MQDVRGRCWELRPEEDKGCRDEICNSYINLPPLLLILARSRSQSSSFTALALNKLSSSSSSSSTTTTTSPRNGSRINQNFITGKALR